MKRMMKSVLAAVALIAAGAVVGCGEGSPRGSSGGSSSGGSSSAGVNASPEAAFKKMSDAARTKDYGAFFDSFTEAGQNELAGGMAVGVSTAVKVGVPGADTKALYDRYKLGELSENKWEDPAGAGDAGRRFAGDQTKLGSQIKEKRAFAVDAMKWGEKGNPKQGEAMKLFSEATISDVKIEGDHASATVMTKDGDKDTMRFTKEGGSWRVDPMGG